MTCLVTTDALMMMYPRAHGSGVQNEGETAMALMMTSPNTIPSSLGSMTGNVVGSIGAGSLGSGPSKFLFQARELTFFYSFLFVLFPVLDLVYTCHDDAHHEKKKCFRHVFFLSFSFC